MYAASSSTRLVGSASAYLGVSETMLASSPDTINARPQCRHSGNNNGASRRQHALSALSHHGGERLHHSAPISPLLEPFSKKLHISFQEADNSMSMPSGSLQGELALHQRSHIDAEGQIQHSGPASPSTLTSTSWCEAAARSPQQPQAHTQQPAANNTGPWSLSSLNVALDYPSPKLARSPARSLSNDGGFAFGAKQEDEERETDRDGYGEELAYLVKRVKVNEQCSMEEQYTMSYIS